MTCYSAIITDILTHGWFSFFQEEDPTEAPDVLKARATELVADLLPGELSEHLVEIITTYGVPPDGWSLATA